MVYLSFQIFFFSNLFSIAEIPHIKSNKAKIWLDLSELNNEFDGIIDHEHKTASMILWQHRLMLAHENNATRLLELTAARGFYIHMDDYTLSGNKVSIKVIIGFKVHCCLDFKNSLREPPLLLLYNSNQNDCFIKEP